MLNKFTEKKLRRLFTLWQNGVPLEECVRVCMKKGPPGMQYDPSGIINIRFPLGGLLDGTSADGVMEWPESMAFYGYPWITRLGVAQPR